jgi:hypothetical protein
LVTEETNTNAIQIMGDNWNPGCVISFTWNNLTGNEDTTVKRSGIMRHHAYNIVDQEFEKFFINNKTTIGSMKIGELWNLRTTDLPVKATGMMLSPWNIRYIGIIDGYEASSVIFLDNRMDKIYSYYTGM